MGFNDYLQRVPSWVFLTFYTIIVIIVTDFVIDVEKKITPVIYKIIDYIKKRKRNNEDSKS